MKKILMAIFALAIATTGAMAGIGVSWSTGGGWGEDGSSGAILDSSSVLWQLIYAGVDNLIDPADGNNGANGFVSDDDIVWDSRTMGQSVGGADVTASDGTVWNNWMQPVSGDTMYLSGWNTANSYVYQRVFNSDTPINGTLYYDSSLTLVVLNFDAGAPTTLTLSETTGGSAFVPDQPVSQVPEPATMGLLGLGALVMAIRRRRS